MATQTIYLVSTVYILSYLVISTYGYVCNCAAYPPTSTLTTMNGDGIITPKEICTIAQYNSISNVPGNMGLNYVLCNSLNFTFGQINPIGSDVAPYTGNFNGNSKGLSDFQINAGFSSSTLALFNMGLFRYLAGANVHDLVITNAYLSVVKKDTTQSFIPMYYVGVLGGDSRMRNQIPTTISNIVVNVNMVRPNDYAVGLVCINNGTIFNNIVINGNIVLAFGNDAVHGVSYYSTNTVFNNIYANIAISFDPVNPGLFTKYASTMSFITGLYGVNNNCTVNNGFLNVNVNMPPLPVLTSKYPNCFSGYVGDSDGLSVYNNVLLTGTFTFGGVKYMNPYGVVSAPVGMVACSNMPSYSGIINLINV